MQQPQAKKHLVAPEARTQGYVHVGAYRASPCQRLDCRLLASRKEREFVVLRHPVGSNLFLQPQETNTETGKHPQKNEWVVRGASCPLVMSQSQMPIQRVREDWVVPMRSSSPCLAGGSLKSQKMRAKRHLLPISPGEQSPDTHSHGWLCPSAATKPCLPAPDTAEGSWRLWLHLCLSCPASHPPTCAWMTSSLGSEAERGKDFQGPVPASSAAVAGVLTVTYPLPCTLRASPPF